MKLNQVTVPSADVNRSVEFYKLLGLELIVFSDAHYARFLCPDGYSTFSVHKVDQQAPGEGVYTYFECDNLDEQVASLVERGVMFDELPSDPPSLLGLSCISIVIAC